MPQMMPSWSLLLCAATLTAGPAAVAAGEPAAADDWQYAASLYFFAPGINGSTAAGSDIDVSFDTLLDNLNMTFMGAFEARKGKWSAAADVLYLNVGANGGGKVPLTTPSGTDLGLKVDAGVKVRGWVLSFLGGYNLRDDAKLSLDVIAGARYLEMKNDFNIALQNRPFGSLIEASALGAVWDAVAGVRGRARLENNWYLPFHLDVGTGESDLTWQAAGGAGYRFDWGDVDLTYRYIAWDFGSGTALDDVSFSGPQLTATFRF
jgi:hypothetical protein